MRRLSWFVVIALASTSVVRPVRGADPQESPEFVRLMNLGKAHLENRNSAKAIESFTAAAKLKPDAASAWRNLARARLLALEHEAVLEVLAKARPLEPESAATAYLGGLAYSRLSRFDEALSQFENAARLDPYTAAIRFQLANTYQALGRDEPAVQQLRETVRLDPMHASAHYKLAGFARKAGDREEFARQSQEFLRLRALLGDAASNAEALERCLHTQPESAPAPLPSPPEAPALPVRFVDATAAAFADPADAAATCAAVLDVDEAGRCTLFVAGEGGRAGVLQMSSEGRFERTPLETKLPPDRAFTFALAGDHHDDVPPDEKYDPKVHALNDVVLAGPQGVCLLKRTGPVAFQEVTEAAGLQGRGDTPSSPDQSPGASPRSAATRAAWMDYEHDGDLDLLLARPEGLQLWQNNGDGRFQEVTSQVGIMVTGAATDAAAIELDNNVAVDLIVARGADPSVVLMNQRAGRFAAMPEPPGPWPPARQVLVDDFDVDGTFDAALIGEREVVVMFGRGTRRDYVALDDLDPVAAAVVDHDNDGQPDLCVAGVDRNDAQRGRVRLWRNADGGAWSDATEATGLDAIHIPPVRSLVAVDVDADSDTDLLLVCADDRLRLLRNDGGGANGQLKVRLAGMKTNPAGLGTLIEVRAGPFLARRYVGQVPIEIGLGGQRRLDSVLTVWTNGVVDNQIDVSVAEVGTGTSGRHPPTLLTITEKNVATGSCPFLYAWDGQRFRFVTDLLGNSPLGLSLRRDVMLPADPDEYVYVGQTYAEPSGTACPGSDLALRDGRYVLMVTEEFRELLYLDFARLVAVDHPADVEVHPTDKLMPPPYPESDVWAMGHLRPLARAIGDDGIDRTEALCCIDGRFAPPGAPLPPPLRGMCRPLTLTLDFGPLVPRGGPMDESAQASGGEGIMPTHRTGTPPDAPLVRESFLAPTGGTGGNFVLALTGWLQYGDASRNIAASQNPSLPDIPPTLEVETADGQWASVPVVVGVPAGKTKTILCDLAGHLPEGARRLRLTTTWEIRWDRIALFERRDLDRGQFHELPLSVADLSFHGFCDLRSRAPGHPTTPDYDAASPTPPWWGTVSGWCTRYGDVLELARRRDDQLILVNAGDALRLEFDPVVLPPAPAGMARSFFFYSVGWDKDGDHNVVDGDTVEPLPVPEPDSPSAADDASDWRLRYNTRWVPANPFAPGYAGVPLEPR